MVEITIDGCVCAVEEGRTIMDAAYAGGVYIPAICHHPSLPPFENIPLAERVYRGDTAIENGGVVLLVDPMSVQYLMGAEIDYKEDLQGAQFIIRNPNATTTCGCGSSFSV